MTKTAGLLAADLIKLNNFQLAGKLVSDELMLGIHGSKRSGMGTEFEQYRHYQPGDDPRRIDWKLFARSGKHLVRESSTESNKQIRFLLDLSGSMNYKENEVSRLAYSQLLIASLAYLGYLQNDLMSLYTLKGGSVQSLTSTSSSGRQSFQKIIFALQGTSAKGVWQPETGAGGSLKFPDLQSKVSEILIFVTDLLQADEEWVRLIRYMAGPRREIVIFQVLGEQETDFRLTGFYRFKDLETGNEIELDAASVREKFRASAAAYLHQIQTDLRMPYVHLVQAKMTDPLGLVLKKYLSGKLVS
jgi:uncharacterized protein (DUF58 family)